MRIAQRGQHLIEQLSGGGAEPGGGAPADVCSAATRSSPSAATKLKASLTSAQLLPCRMRGLLNLAAPRLESSPE